MPGRASRSAGGERGDAVGMVRDRFRGVAIRADLERVLVLDLEEIADFRQHACDCEVVHQEIMRRTCRVVSYNASMSIRDIRRHAGQLAIAGFAGHAIPAELRTLAREFDLGGIILFARNVESPEQVAEIAREAQAMAGELPLWVSVDQEGGRVARLQARRSPCGRRCRRSGGAATTRWRCDSRKALAAELQAVGITLDYTPVLDILTNPKNPAIGDRALAERAEDVARLGRRDHHDPAGRRHRRLRQALSRARRHQHRLASRAAAHRASARSAGRGRAGAVPARHRRRRRRRS